MKKISISSIYLVMIFLFSGCAMSPIIAGTDYEKRAVGLQLVITQIQSALALVNGEVEQKTNLVLKSAFLVANTEIGKLKEGKAGLWLVSGKVSKENKISDKISIKLVPITDEPFIKINSNETLSKRLAMSIISAVEGVSNAEDKKYPMRVDELIIEMAITTKTNGSAEIGVELEILPISFGGKGEYSKDNLNTLKLEFGQKKS